MNATIILLMSTETNVGGREKYSIKSKSYVQLAD